MFWVNEASACGVLVDERRVTEERGGLVTVLTLAVREDLGGFQDWVEERRVKELLGGISPISQKPQARVNYDAQRASSTQEHAKTVPGLPKQVLSPRLTGRQKTDKGPIQ